jgi:L-amino acid N-acyltransferase YncA
MNSTAVGFRIRPAEPDDAVALCAILNSIIAIGGTTAMEVPLGLAEFVGYFLEGEDVLSCFVAEDRATARRLGFQGLSRHPELPQDWADIGTFTGVAPKTPGVGTALFAATRGWARAHGVAVVNAAIRADNRGGLAYYEKMGFRQYQVLTGVPLRDGTPVDRIFKKYVLE